MLCFAVLPLNSEQFQQPLYFFMDAWKQVAAMRNIITAELQQVNILGKFFESGLDVLPLPEAPTIQEIELKDMANHHTIADSDFNYFPSTPIGRFFKRFNLETDVTEPTEPFIHFLVWLPPKDRKSLYLHTLINTSFTLSRVPSRKSN